jgi:Mce-associated membrane protein
MTSPERRVSALDVNGRDDSPEATVLELTEEAQAEAAAAEAEARAAAARARAIRLRREADSVPSDHSADADPAESDDDDAVLDTPAVGASRPRRLRRPSTKAMAVVGAGIVLICAALAASGYMFWQDRMALQQRHRAAEYAAAARQDIAALMSLDFNKASDDMQHIADNSTGNFKNSFPVIAEQLTKGLEQSKVTTTVTVNDVAVESMTDNSAIVLVAATTEAQAPGKPPQPRPWHIAVGMRMDGGKPKMANIEFVQ